MYKGFNPKRERKRTKVEMLQDEIKRLHKMLGTMIHLHERLKNERSEGSEVAKVPTLPSDTLHNSERIEATPNDLSQGSSGEPTLGKDQKGA
jgi:hypothetical protein